MNEQINSPFDFVNRDPMGDYVKFNEMSMPYDYKDMANASFEQAYYYGLGAKAYQYGRRMMDSDPQLAPEVLNKEYKTDIFSSPLSRTLADDMIAMHKKRQELDSIINQGTGGFWSDKVSWFGGQLGGGVVDPTNVAAGYGAGKLAASVVSAGIARVGTEALISGVATSAGYQALAPEQGEERSLSVFGQDVVLGGIIELGLHGIGKGAKAGFGKLKTVIPESYNKLKAAGKKSADQLQAVAEESFHDGKKVQAEEFQKANTKDPILSNDAKSWIDELDSEKADYDPAATSKIAYVVKNEQGDYISIGSSIDGELIGSSKFEDVVGLIPSDSGNNTVVAFDLEQAKVAVVNPDTLLSVLDTELKYKNEKVSNKLKNSVAVKLPKHTFDNLNSIKEKLLDGLDSVQMVPRLGNIEYRYNLRQVNPVDFDPTKHPVFHGSSDLDLGSVEKIKGFSSDSEIIRGFFDSDYTDFRQRMRLSDVGPAVYTAIDFAHANDFAKGGAIAELRMKPDFKTYVMPVYDKLDKYYIPAMEEVIPKYIAELDEKAANLEMNDPLGLVANMKRLKEWNERLKNADVGSDTAKAAYSLVKSIGNDIEGELFSSVSTKAAYIGIVKKNKASFIEQLKLDGFDGILNDVHLDPEPALAIIGDIGSKLMDDVPALEVGLPPIIPEEIASDLAKLSSPEEIRTELDKYNLTDEQKKYIAEDIMKVIEDHDRESLIITSLLNEVNRNNVDVHELLPIIKKEFPDEYTSILKNIAKDSDVLQVGNKRIILNPENLKKADLKPSKEMFAETPTPDPRKIDEFKKELDSNKSDMDFDEDAANSAAELDEQLKIVDEKPDTQEATLIAQASQLEKDGLLSPEAKKTLKATIEEKAFFSERESIFKQFANCLIKGN